MKNNRSSNCGDKKTRGTVPRKHNYSIFIANNQP